MSTLTSAPILPGTGISPKHRQESYTLPDGSVRVICGQRVLGHVRFQPEETVVLDPRPASSEDGECRPRGADEQEERADAARPKRPNNDAVDTATAEPGSERRGRTGPRVELGRYVTSEGERALYGQRVWGVVRVIDVPLKAGGRACLVERGLEEDGNAALQALVADYLDQARRLGRCPLQRAALLTDTRPITLLAPAATKDSPFVVMIKYGVNSWPEAIAARAAARRQANTLAAA